MMCLAQTVMRVVAAAAVAGPALPTPLVAVMTAKARAIDGADADNMQTSLVFAWPNLSIARPSKSYLLGLAIGVLLPLFRALMVAGVPKREPN